MKREDAARALNLEYQKQRDENEREHERRVQEAVARDPEIASLADGGASLFRQAARSFLFDPEAARQNMLRAREQATRMNEALRKRLAAAGLPQDYLEPVYRCAKCQDKGFIADPVQRHCECFVKRLNEKMYESAGLSGGAVQSFETFDPAFIPEDMVEGTGKTQRQISLTARDRCERFADRYPEVPKVGMLLIGNTGLGKSFLLNCVARRLIDRGFSPVKMTAYRLFEVMRGAHFGDEEKYREFERLISCPLLLIDDLGTEPQMKNVTEEYFFTLLNERVGGGCSTLIATNLTFEDLKRRYEERVLSRLLDKSRFEVIGLMGRDLRLIPRRNA